MSRRTLTTVVLVTLVAACWPSRAEAGFWDWIDGLSGPSFSGVGVQWRFYCFKEAPETPPPPPLEPAVLGFPIGGSSFSTCSWLPGERRRGSLDLNVDYGWTDGHRLVAVGPSFTWRVVPSLELSAAAGIATFRSNASEDWFAKAYVQPYRADWVPLPLIRRWRDSPWAHVPYVRYAGLTFPQGFEAGRFGDSPEYGAELVHQYGIFLDFDPLIRKLRKTW